MGYVFESEVYWGGGEVGGPNTEGGGARKKRLGTTAVKEIKNHVISHWETDPAPLSHWTVITNSYRLSCN